MDDFKLFYDEEEDILYLAKEGEEAEVVEISPDPEIDRIWAEEAKKRWKAYKVGKVETVSYERVMKKHSAG